MNELRVPLIVDNLRECQTDGSSRDPRKSLSGLKIIDVGCGGGLLTEVCSVLFSLRL